MAGDAATATLKTDFIVDMLNVSGFEYDDIHDVIHDDYSGRRMNGQTCFGIVADENGPNTLAAFLLLLGSTHPALANYMSRNVQVDEFGLSNIYYWPTLRLDKPLDDL